MAIKNFVLSATCMAMVGMGCAVDTTTKATSEFVETTSEAISVGYTETAINAVVRIGDWCTGTLIRPDLVLTNAHCLGGTGPEGYWNPISPIPIYVGPTHPGYTFTTNATYFMQPPPSNMGEDVALLGLSTPVPASKATWLRVWSNAPGTAPLVLDADWKYTIPGWGEALNSLATTRKAGDINGFLTSCPGQINMRGFTWVPPATGGIGGDSGSPVLFPAGVGADIPGPSGRVVAGVYGNSSCGNGFLANWTTGGGGKPDIAAWLTNNGTRSFCAQQGKMLSLDGHYRRLQNWFSEQRLDNHASTDDGYFGCYDNWTDTIYPGGPYGYLRQEGWVADPADPAPAGTVPLNLYWNPAPSRDNATTTAGAAPPAPWSFVKNLGYVWTTSAADRVALRVWYNASIQDFYTTTLTLDYSGSGYVRWGGGGTGIVGYVRTNASVL